MPLLSRITPPLHTACQKVRKCENPYNFQGKTNLFENAGVVEKTTFYAIDDRSVNPILEAAKQYSSEGGKILHIIKNIIKSLTFIPFVIDKARMSDKKGGSTSSIFRENSIIENLTIFTTKLWALPSDFEGFKNKLGTIDNKLGRLLFSTTELSVYQNSNNEIIAYENDLFFNVKPDTKQVIFSGTKEEDYLRFRTVLKSLNKQLQLKQGNQSL